jgi:hypothetical protein
MTETSNQKPLNVLFLGGRNAVRSIMAEAVLNREGMGRYRAFSAGREPSGKVHPAALDLLSKLNFDVSASLQELAGIRGARRGSARFRLHRLRQRRRRGLRVAGSTHGRALGIA